MNTVCLKCGELFPENSCICPHCSAPSKAYEIRKKRISLSTSALISTLIAIIVMLVGFYQLYDEKEYILLVFGLVLMISSDAVFLVLLNKVKEEENVLEAQASFIRQEKMKRQKMEKEDKMKASLITQKARIKAKSFPKFCEKCGASLTPDLCFCGKCGNKIPEAFEAKEEGITRESLVSLVDQLDSMQSAEKMLDYVKYKSRLLSSEDYLSISEILTNKVKYEETHPSDPEKTVSLIRQKLREKLYPDNVAAPWIIGDGKVKCACCGTRQNADRTNCFNCGVKFS